MGLGRSSIFRGDSRGEKLPLNCRHCRQIAADSGSFAAWRQFKGEIAAGSGNIAAISFFEQVQKVV